MSQVRGLFLNGGEGIIKKEEKGEKRKRERERTEKYPNSFPFCKCFLSGVY
jgi:hypothetical protein